MDRNDIVVALDGSERSLEALRWAARESQLTGDRLVVLHTFEIDDEHPDPSAMRITTESVHRTHATAWLRRALEECAAIPYSIRLEVTEGRWLDVLRRRAARSASMVVIGVDGRRTPEVSKLGVPVVLVPGAAATPADSAGPRRASAARVPDATTVPA